MPSRASRLLPLVAVLLALGGGLAACGGDDEPDTDSVALTELPRNAQNDPSAPGRPASGRLATGGDGGAADAGDAAGSGDAADEMGDGDVGDAGSGDGGDEGAQRTSDPEGEAIFSQSCAGCHTLAAANATGSVGPNLDETSLDEAGIAAKIRAGGGGMPSFAGQLEQAQIDAVAAYVASSSGS